MSATEVDLPRWNSSVKGNIYFFAKLVLLFDHKSSPPHQLSLINLLDLPPVKVHKGATLQLLGSSHPLEVLLGLELALHVLVSLQQPFKVKLPSFLLLLPPGLNPLLQGDELQRARGAKRQVRDMWGSD